MTSLFEMLTHSGLENLGNSDHCFLDIYTCVKHPVVGICAISIRYILAVIEKPSAITLAGHDLLVLRALFIYFLALSYICYACLILSWNILC